ncbi:MAG: hypothetical protein ACYSUN_05230 [Planctomycetota bacterium]|jgi:hypothetical protein
MSADLLILLLCAALSAYGTAVAFKLKVRWRTTVPAILFYVYAGIHLALLGSFTGDGQLVPGYQLNPEMVWHAAALIPRAALNPYLGLLAIAAHLLVVLPRPNRTRCLLPMPATLLFVVLTVMMQKRVDAGPPQHALGIGPDRIAYLTLQSTDAGSGARLILASGRPEDRLLEVRMVRSLESAPPRVRVYWTKDGEGLVLSVRNKRLLALAMDGREVGWLPSKSHEWPSEVPYAESLDTQRKLSQAQRDVAEFVKTHGGIYLD